MDRRRFSPDDEVAPRAWAGLAVVAAALLVATLDAMVLYVAFGTIRRDFPDVSAAALSWILSGYTIVLALGLDALRRSVPTVDTAHGSANGHGIGYIFPTL